MGFIVSKHGICVDKKLVESIPDLPPQTNISSLQSLQGKSNFLCHFIPQYDEITKGFIHFLKKDVPFVWDEWDQQSFDSLKSALTHAPLLHPLVYTHDFLLYLEDFGTTITMVLVQEIEDNQKHVVYYMSKTLTSFEIRYSHIEKLVLATFIVVQCFHHYILLCKTTIIVESNPMYYVLTRQGLEGKYSRWIVIPQEFHLEFMKAKAKKSIVFAKLICDLPHSDQEVKDIESYFPDDSIFLITTIDPWYGNILQYLQTQHFRFDLSHEACRSVYHYVKSYLILDDTLYHRGIHHVFLCFLTLY